MKIALACVLFSSVAVSAKPPAPKPKWPTIAWGEPVGGVKVGVESLPLPRTPYPLNCTVRFFIYARNIDKVPITLFYSRQDGLFCPATVGRPDKKPLSNLQRDTVWGFNGVEQYNLSGPTWDNEVTIKPGTYQRVSSSYWPMERYYDETTSGFWGEWKPGKYTFAFPMTFTGPKQNNPRLPRQQSRLWTGALTVEFSEADPSLPN